MTGPTCTGPACTWVAPWDEPWVKIHKLSRPMFVVLYDADDRGHGPSVRMLGHGGQSRMIRAALYRRGLIDETRHLTAAGLVLSVWAKCAVHRAYPARPGEVTTR